MRQYTNGSNSGLEAGVQASLQLYNGPPVIVNELKGTTEISSLPRYSSMANIQPSLAVADFGVGSKLFDIGMTSRNLWLDVTANSSLIPRAHLEEDDVQVTEFILALAARTLVVNGSYEEYEDTYY